MELEQVVVEFFVTLSQHGAALEEADDASDPQLISTDHVAAVRRLCAGLRSGQADQAAWQWATDAGVSFISVARAIAAQLRSQTSGAAVQAAALYSTLLSAKHGPVSALFNPLLFSAFLQVLKSCTCTAASAKPAAGAKDAAPARGGGKGGRGRKRQHAETESEEEAAAGGSDGDEPAATQKASGTRHAAAAGDHGQAMLADLAVFARDWGMSEQQEMLHMLMDACVEVLAANPAAPAAKAGARGSSKHAASVSELTYTVLDGLMDPRHGPIGSTCTLLMMRLLPTLLGSPSPAAAGAGAANKRGSAQEAAARRAAALQYILGLYRRFPDAVQPPLQALARQLCLRALDKAEMRAAALSGALELVSALPAREQRSMCLWLLQLSHTAKPLHRLVAVDLACSMLTSLHQPFGPQAGYKAFVDGSHGPGDDIDAPWSAVLVALLVQRCDDKAAAVRARAVGHLADVMAHCAPLLSMATHDDEDDVQAPHRQRLIPPQAEGYLLALCGVPCLQTSLTQGTLPDGTAAGAAAAQPVARPKPPGKAGARKAGKGKAARGRRNAATDEESEPSDDSDGGDAAADGAAAAVAAPAAAARGTGAVSVPQLAASLPSQIHLDLGPLMRLAHRRLQDDKAPVRKGALALLEAGLLLRAGLPEPVRGTPGPQDILAVEAATADALVSVRKAALAAASRLVSQFPQDPGCCELWVRAALPLIRDAETSIQESLLDQVGSTMVQPLAAVASPSAALASNAMERVKPLLAALAAAGRGPIACLGRAITALAAKKQLPAKKVASGLEAIIQHLQAAADAAGAASAGGAGAAAGAAGPVQGQVAGGTAAAAARLGRQQLLGAWGVLREVSAVDPAATSWQFLQASWAALQAAGRGASSSGEQGAALLWVMSNSAARFPPEAAQKLGKDLLQALLAFTLPPAAASAHISALHRLCGSTGTGTGTGSSGALAGWSSQLMEGAHQVLAKLMDKRQQRDESATWRACAALFVVGEVALLGLKPPAGLVVKVQALTHPALPSSGVPASQQLLSQLPSQLPLTQGELGSQQLAGPGPMDVWQEVPLTQGLGGEAGGGVEGGQAGLTSSSLCGMAWLCLGKLCLTDELLAKKAAPLFVQELSRSPSPVVRNNCLVALADMCIHFTALVDGYLPRLAGLIRDPHELVRRQALALLANLLMKEYVKWRGALFHRFALALVDPSPAVKQLAEHLLGDTLATKAPMLVYNHFIECMFVLNGCQAGLHASRLAGLGKGSGGAEAAAVAGGMTDAGGSQADALAAARDAAGQFALRGSSQHMREQRDVVYHTLLRKMSAENKFSTHAKLASEVLAAVADGVLPLAEPGVEEVLGDALRLLASKHLKVVSSRMAASEEDVLLAAAGGEGQGATQAVAEAVRVKGKIVSGLMKKHLVEHLVPLLCELKHMLQEAHSPLLGGLMHCLGALLKEHKTELEDILVGDKQLAKEIMYDLKQAEQAAKQQAQAQAAQAKAAAAAAAAGGAAAATLTPRPATTARGRRPGAAAEDDDEAREEVQDGGAAARAARGMATPGAAIRTSTATVARTPATAAAAAMLRNARTPGGALAGRTPSTAGRTAGAGDTAGGAARAAPTPAPVSTAKAAAARAAAAAAGADDDDDDDEPAVAGAAKGEVLVALPPLSAAAAPQRQWKVQLQEQPASGEEEAAKQAGPGRRARRGATSKQPAAGGQAASTATTTTTTTTATTQGPGSKRAGSSKAAAAAAAAAEVVAAMTAADDAAPGEQEEGAKGSGKGGSSKAASGKAVAGKKGSGGSSRGRRALQQVNQ